MAANATKTRKTQKAQSEGSRQVLANPFKVGEQVTIPAGTPYTSTAPTLKGRQVVKRAHKVVVSETTTPVIAPRNSEKGSKVLVRPVRIRAKGSGGYWKDITLTEKIVKANGKTPTYETLAL